MPCSKMIGPVFDSLSDQYPNVTFLKVRRQPCQHACQLLHASNGGAFSKPVCIGLFSALEWTSASAACRLPCMIIFSEMCRTCAAAPDAQSTRSDHVMVDVTQASHICASTLPQIFIHIFIVHLCPVVAVQRSMLMSALMWLLLLACARCLHSSPS